MRKILTIAIYIMTSCSSGPAWEAQSNPIARQSDLEAVVENSEAVSERLLNRLDRLEGLLKVANEKISKAAKVEATSAEQLLETKAVDEAVISKKYMDAVYRTGRFAEYVKRVEGGYSEGGEISSLQFKYKYASSLYRIRKYNAAAIALVDLIDDEMFTDNKDTAILILGHCYRKTKDHKSASYVYKHLVLAYPSSKAAKKAKRHLKRLRKKHPVDSSPL